MFIFSYNTESTVKTRRSGDRENRVNVRESGKVVRYNKFGGWGK